MYNTADVFPHRPPVPSQPPDEALSSSSVSLRDTMRQRYSVTWHPRLPCLIVSDGYMVTALNISSRPASSSLMSSILMEATRALERVRKLIHSELVSRSLNGINMPSFRQLVVRFGWKATMCVDLCDCSAPGEVQTGVHVHSEVHRDSLGT